MSSLTVFIPNYNHAHFLPESLGSLERQSCQPNEIIIIDDASTDDSVQIIEEFARRNPHVRFIRNETNQGVVVNENRALQIASSEYFFGFSADDRLHLDFFEKSMRLLSTHPDAGFCSALVHKIDEFGNDLGAYWTPNVADSACYLSPQQVREALRRHGPWFMGSTAIWRRQALQDVGGHYPELDWYFDGFMAQVLALRYGVCFIPELLGDFRQVAGQVSVASYDVRSAFPIYRRAFQLMRTEYRELFPQDYVDSHERRTLVYTLEQSIQRANQEHLRQFRSLLTSPRWRDRLLLQAVRIAMCMQFVVAKIGIAIALRRDGWRAFGRMLKNVFRRFTGRSINRRSSSR